MDRLINENAVLSAIGEWIAHNEHTYTNATEYLRNRVKAIKTAEQEPCEDVISRAEAIKALGYDISIESDRGLDEYKSVIKEMLCKIYDVQKANIEKLPPVTPKQKTDVLDKIRAEIKEESRFCPLTEGLERALEIIDKYTAENTSNCDSCEYKNEVDGSNCYECVKGIRNNYKAESEGKE